MTAPVERMPPGPRGLWLLGSLLDVRGDRLGFITDMTRRYGDVVRFRMGPRHLFLVSRHEHVRHVLQENGANYRKGVGLAEAKRWLGNGLVTSEGDVWSRQRRLVQAAFARHQVDRLGPLVATSTTAMLDRWTASCARGQAVDIASEMMQLTLSIIARLMFSTEFDNKIEIGSAFTTALHNAMDQMMAMVALPHWMPFPGRLRFRRAIRTLNAIVRQIIHEHESPSFSGCDLVSTLLKQRSETDVGFDAAEVRDQVMTILLAGHETTASSLAWTLYALDRNPDVLTRVQEEVASVLQGGVPTEESLSRLVYTRLAYQESMRLYPPVWLIPRRAIGPDRIGDFTIPAGADVLISPWVLHRQETFWPEPDVFDPTRFAPERAQGRPRYAYLPFGAGPRACVASSFAMMEALLILSMVVSRFRPHLAQNCKIVPDPLLTLRFRNGLRMNLAAA